MAAALVSASSVLVARSAFSGRALQQSRPGPRAQAPRAVIVAAGRQLWLPGGPVPSHLDGSLPADYGFDPLGLGKDPDALKWYQQAEVFHCRFAMAGVAGILIPAVLSKAGLFNVPAWYNAGKEGMYIPFSTLLMVELFLFGFVETKRWMDIKKPGSQAEPGSFFGFESAFKGTGEPGYPGGPFDPLGLSKGSKAAYEDFKVKEIKNGRLAMVAFLGFCAQYVATGKDPLTNLGDHVANPALNNFATNGVSLPFKTW